MDANWKKTVFGWAEKMIRTGATPLFYKELAWKAANFAATCGQSHPISFAMRPVAYYRHLRRLVGWGLVLLVGGFALVKPLPGIATDTGGAPSLVVLPESEPKFLTEETVKWPVTSREISQKFWLLHGGLDIRTPDGSPINPVMAGVVQEIEFGKFGYGIKIVISHTNGYQSLYAHLSQVFVKVGELVTTDRIIGLSGNTGRSTGPHLHLEIRLQGKLINPLSVLENH